MRVSPDDRRNLAQLGLTILVIGLVVTPLSHALVDHAGVEVPSAEQWLSHGDAHGHSHGHKHSHSHSEGGRQHTHSPENLQHLTALFAPAAPPPQAVQAQVVELEEAQAPVLVARADAWLHPAMEQGP